MAFLFGLVLGLGFAGAPQQIGLPERHLWIARLTFNAGVEIGQLAVVGAARAGRPQRTSNANGERTFEWWSPA